MGKRMDTDILSAGQRLAIGRTATVALLADEALTESLLRGGGPAMEAAAQGRPPPAVQPRLARALQSIFALQGGHAFDVCLSPVADGHRLEFSLQLPQPTRGAPDLPGEGARFTIEIGARQPPSPAPDSRTIHLHASLARVCVKLRAICQQMPAYRRFTMGAGPGVPLAGHFVGIEALVRGADLALNTAAARQMLELAFFAQCVPLELVSGIGRTRAFHEPGFAQLRAALGPDAGLQDFGHYFDCVVDTAGQLMPPMRS